jgi:hypothetical protein
MKSDNFQLQLFAHLKEVMPAHLSMVDELGDLLNLSPDSVYRRIRGEKELSINELKEICIHYQLSLDHLLDLNEDSVLFKAPGMSGISVEFVDYLNDMLKQLKYFNSFEKKEMNYLCKDSTLWNFYLFPELAAFKTFFWSKTINEHPDLHDKIFSYEEFPFTECFKIGQQILQEYNQIPSVELWNLESMHSTINQILYYKDAGNFKTNDDFVLVLESFHKMINHLQLQTEKGFKFMPGATDVSYKASIQFYVNELILGNNTMVINLNGKSLTMVTYSVLHYLFTRNPTFSASVLDSFHNLLSRSTLISQSAEKERNRFFNTLRQKINAMRD